MPGTAAAPRQGATLPLFAAQAPDKVSGLFHAGTILARLLEKGRTLDDAYRATSAILDRITFADMAGTHGAGHPLAGSLSP
ncbi:MAG: hypothetical protein EA405_11790 [Rhodospirillales bacterium]|nr:MAG: hypothetical protein EA405_11790 [Rhodospirillales bacterium]